MTDLLKAILFDLDDTILAFSASADVCWRRVCDAFACRIDGCAPDRLLAAIWEYRDWFWSDTDRHRRGRLDLVAARSEIVAGALARLGVMDPALVQEIARSYALQRDEAIELCPGALETLQRLRDHRVRLALLTNGRAEDQRRKIERWGLGSFFDCILIEGELGFGKPDERVYRRALELLGVAPEEAWMVGDHLEWDVAAAQRLGIYGIWLDWAGTGLPENNPVRPDRIIRSLGELV